MPRDANDPFWVDGEAIDSGLEVFRQAAPPSARSFSATFVAPAGWAYEPAGSEGLALVTSLVQAAAAGRRDRVELARFLDRHGATLTRRVAPESAEVTVWGPAWSFDPLMGLLADVVLRPRFDPTDLERVRRQVYERQLREESQPASRAERELLAAIFPPTHPYHRTGTGTRRSVTRLRKRDLERFHREHFSAEGSLLVVTARSSLPEVLRDAAKRFDGIDRTTAPKPPAVPRIRPVRAHERKIPMAGRSQVEVLIGGTSIRRSDERYPEAFLGNEVLGGGLL
ncbi:MAG TPA: insulinase family protein, partial [Thermoplasmata archaeon]